MTQPVHHTSPYQVLARTTRPKKFSDVIGQEAIAQTLKSALESGRLAHAFILTGTHGVGKTTMARLIACALNCVAEGKGGAQLSEPCGQCDQCQAVFQDRHVDVMEVDAATRTGVDDMRQLMDGVSYKPVLGRYKVYIIDEVHMLSKSAFNALLKTLEEPPPHVKFIFATTEIRKVPLTVLSRCQRFDLRRVSVDVLIDHFKKILDQEKVPFERDALECIAKAAGGSVRDGLSILEQAIIKSSTATMTLSVVQEMLGLADKGKLNSIFEFLLRGQVKECLESLRDLYMEGSDPDSMLQDFMGLTYDLLSFKVGALKKISDERLKSLAPEVSAQSLMLIWQVLLRGGEEMKLASFPLESLEVILIRAMHIQSFLERGDSPSEDGINHSPSSAKVTTTPHVYGNWEPKTFEDVVQLFEKKREPIIADYLMNSVGLVQFEPGRLKLTKVGTARENLQSKIAKLLSEYTKSPWTVEITEEQGQKPLAALAKERKENREKEVLETDEAKKISALFPGAQVQVVVK